MSYYFLSIGGTGNKILESLVYACAVDAFYTVDANARHIPLPAINALIIDVDAACGNTTRAKQASEHYESIRKAYADFPSPHRGFHTALSVDRWNMNLAKRAASVSGMTQNHKRDRLLAQTLFTATEASLEYSEGFRGHPDLGVLFFADLLNNLDERAADGQPDEMVTFLAKMQADLDAGETVYVMLAGSIFGGTGASGIPSVSRFLRERFRAHSDRFVLSSVLMLPYYKVPPAGVDESLEIVVNSDTFLDKARTALQYYGMEGMIRSSEDDAHGVYDALFLLGLPQEAFVTTRLYSTGSQSQENDAHLLEWLATRCAAKFFRTGYRGEDAHNIDCYYYQWHSREVSWECFDEEAALYRAGYGGLVKSAAAFFAECYPTLRACVKDDARRRARTVNYFAAYFGGLRKATPAQRAKLEKLIEALYKLLAFYVNWMVQVMSTLPPTLRREREIEALTREVSDAYDRQVELRVIANHRAQHPEKTYPDNEELRAELDMLESRMKLGLLQIGGKAYLSVMKDAQKLLSGRLSARRELIAELEGRIARADADADPVELAQRKEQLRLHNVSMQVITDRIAVVAADVTKAAAQNVLSVAPAVSGEQNRLIPDNALFSSVALAELHDLLSLFGTDFDARDTRRVDALSADVLARLAQLVKQPVPDRVGATQLIAGMGGGRYRGSDPTQAVCAFWTALLDAAQEEDNA